MQATATPQPHCVGMGSLMAPRPDSTTLPAKPRSSSMTTSAPRKRTQALVRPTRDWKGMSSTATPQLGNVAESVRPERSPMLASASTEARAGNNHTDDVLIGGLSGTIAPQRGSAALPATPIISPKVTSASWKRTQATMENWKS